MISTVWEIADDIPTSVQAEYKHKNTLWANTNNLNNPRRAMEYGAGGSFLSSAGDSDSMFLLALVAWRRRTIPLA